VFILYFIFYFHFVYLSTHHNKGVRKNVNITRYVNKDTDKREWRLVQIWQRDTKHQFYLRGRSVHLEFLSAMI